MFDRYLAIKDILRKSIFLLGPRQTGKSTLLQMTFKKAYWVDLLKARTFRELAANPELLGQRIENNIDEIEIVIIDEIQKLPLLLDEVHSIIEKYKSIRFILTGSSARKLRKVGVNLLGGRANRHFLNPICYKELMLSPSLNKTWEDKLQWGGLPSILLSTDKKEDLINYVDLYLKEEIQAEAISRSIGNFSRFLDAATLCNAEQLNYTKVGNDSGVAPRTVKDYFQVLEDTLFAHTLPVYNKTKKRKSTSIAKFYFFDTGVANALASRWQLKQGTTEYGKALEHLIFTEIKAAIDYLKTDTKMFYWRSLSKFEVDFVLKTGISTFGIEVKGSRHVASTDEKGLLALNEDVSKLIKIIISLEDEPRLTKNGTKIFPVEIFLDKLWKGDFFQ